MFERSDMGLFEEIPCLPRAIVTSPFCLYVEITGSRGSSHTVS